MDFGYDKWEDTATPLRDGYEDDDDKEEDYDYT